MHYIVKRSDLPCTLEELLLSKWHFSKRLIRECKRSAGSLQVNGTQSKVITELMEGDHIHIQFPKEERSSYLTPEYIPLSIIYEDDDLLILNKEAGIAVSPSANHSSGTLANGVIYYYDTHHLPYTVHFVTRLDRDTSGIVIIAKHRHMHALLNNELQNGFLKRSYEAIIEGNLHSKLGTIHKPIARKPGSIVERSVDVSGQEAITHYRVIKRNQRYSHIAIELETGRTHQIRVHFAHIGHPLVGDHLYGGAIGKINQQALHCTSVTFVHPYTQQPIYAETPIRKDMNMLLYI